ncbi:MAG: hypothetical protein K4571_16535 [Deltaproteobacteria bacterium]
MLKMVNSKAPRQTIYFFGVFCLMLSVLLISSCSGGGSSAPPINPLSSAKDITAFSILGESGTITGNTITLTLPLPNGTVVTALVATFTTTGETVRVGALIQVSGQTANNFSNPVTYRVTAEDASTKDYVVTVTVAPPPPPPPAGQILAGHQAAANFNAIPQAWIQAARANLHIAYGHTSHGSQIITGMNALADANNLYAWNDGGTGGALDLRDGAMGGDVGYYPDWVNNTRSYLGPPNPNTGRGTTQANVNVIIWSWCGQASSKTRETMISEYLAPMTQLEADYPGIKFVYMTGHLEGTGENGDLNVRNQQIRDYCNANNKILFDFADIESYDPVGFVNYMLLQANDNCDYDSNNDDNPDSNWAINWVTAHPGDALTPLANHCDANGCAHSQGLNCALKGRAAWWLWARLAGWNGNP